MQLIGLRRRWSGIHWPIVCWLGIGKAESLALRRKFGFSRRDKVVALLPGSRLTEVGRLAEPMLGAAAWLAARAPDLKFIVPLANEISAQLFRAAKSRGDYPPIYMTDGQSIEAMAASDVVLAASGTATLEAMLVGRPMVITYRTHELTWKLGRRLLHVPYVGLPNLLAGRQLVPEFLQHDARPERLGGAVLQLLEQPALGESLLAEFGRLGAELRKGANGRAADAVIEVAGS